MYLHKVLGSVDRSNIIVILVTECHVFPFLSKVCLLPKTIAVHEEYYHIFRKLQLTCQHFLNPNKIPFGLKNRIGLPDCSHPSQRNALLSAHCVY